MPDVKSETVLGVMFDVTEQPDGTTKLRHTLRVSGMPDMSIGVEIVVKEENGVWLSNSGRETFPTKGAAVRAGIAAAVATFSELTSASLMLLQTMDRASGKLMPTKLPSSIN